MTPDAQAVIRFLRGDGHGWTHLTARLVIDWFPVGLVEADAVIAELVEVGVLAPPEGQTLVDRLERAYPTIRAAFADPVTLDWGPRARLSSLAERRVAA